MADTQPHTWLKYIDSYKKRAPKIAIPNYNPFDEIINNINFHPLGLFDNGAPILYLNDYRTGRYVFLSDSIKFLIGFTAEGFMKEGISYAASLFHKDDLQLFSKEIFPDRLRFLKSICPTEHKDYVFSYNFRIRTKAGKYISILQKNSFIQSDLSGNPVMSLGLIYDVSNYANPNKVVHIIEKVAEVSGQREMLRMEQKNYYQHDDSRQFSRREKEVLLWMADGLTSKEIAKKLFLSEHTVINHRRNMQDKTNTSNAISLVAYSIKMNLI